MAISRCTHVVGNMVLERKLSILTLSVLDWIFVESPKKYQSLRIISWKITIYIDKIQEGKVLVIPGNIRKILLEVCQVAAKKS